MALGDRDHLAMTNRALDCAHGVSLTALCGHIRLEHEQPKQGSTHHWLRVHIDETNVSPVFVDVCVAPGVNASPTVFSIVGGADLEAMVVHPTAYARADPGHASHLDHGGLLQPIFSKLPAAGINGNHEVIQSCTGYSHENYLDYLNRAATPITQANPTMSACTTRSTLGSCTLSFSTTTRMRQAQVD
ncbi:hypothetical protein H257_14502 [Aphanomyces astaci]|uniref:Uncharacterized protein n=1 Tax=Aphanomyces astaci TaxID=112090 RepID=W4FTB5_APHAT|nr:hypothetical protein H257_14502 [Aphanomyces astaci]ETV69903.1 hypothetical protein H257_14502 [Aphanomyces astaci]|eukprot:XP_009840641.1 hypothetical protein H257_14502 [Aphanomyces astaci]